MSKLWESVLETIYELGNNSGCHQLPERSFFYKSWQFPVCARCTGVTIGQFTAIVLALFKRFVSFPHAMFLLIIMGFDWGIQAIRIKESTNLRRLLTGFCGGLGLFSIYIIIFKQIINYIRSNIFFQH